MKWKPEKAYFIVANKQGMPIVPTFGHTATRARELAFETFGDAWHKLYGRGYRVVKVQLNCETYEYELRRKQLKGRKFENEDN